MTTLTDRPHTALLVIDVQNSVVAGTHEREAVVARIAALVDKARAEGVPVVWVQHSDDNLAIGSDDWAIVPELAPEESEPHIQKRHGDAFQGTDLGEVLAAAEVGRVVVAGAHTHACIRSTIHGAFTRGYDVTLVGDAHTTDDQTAAGSPPPDQMIEHVNLEWRSQSAPGRTALVVEAKDVTFRGE
jgi:nicotinamidase-related amidase